MSARTVGCHLVLKWNPTISRVIIKPGPLTVMTGTYTTQSDKEINGFTVTYSFGEGYTYTHQKT